MINIKPCSKCSTTDYPKYIRKRTQGKKIRYNKQRYCILCRREDCKNWYEKLISNPKKKKRLWMKRRVWARENKGKVKEIRKRHALKRKNKPTINDVWFCSHKDILGNYCGKAAYHRTAKNGRVTISCDEHLKTGNY